MSGNEQVMAVLLEEEDLRMVHRDWPRKMRLAVCLMPSGDCQLLLFRQEEAGIFAARLRKHLGLRAEELCVYPPVHGFPTRQLRYSDERSLAALLADSPQLVEEAGDYSVNFAFALEEGLDPVEFLGVEAAETEVDFLTEVKEVSAAEAGSLRFSSRRAPVDEAPKPSVRKLSFDLAREAERFATTETPNIAAAASEPEQVKPVSQAPALPGAAFKPVSDLHDHKPPAYQLREEATHFVISNGAGPLVEIENGGQLFLRDDRQLLAIHVDHASRQPGTVRINTDILPASLKSALRAACGDVKVSLENSFLYVELPVEQDGSDTAKTEPVLAQPTPAKTKQVKSSPALVAQKSAKRRAAFRLLALTTLTTLAILAVLGLQPIESIKQKAENGPIDWSQFRLSMQSEQ